MEKTFNQHRITQRCIMFIGFHPHALTLSCITPWSSRTYQLSTQERQQVLIVSLPETSNYVENHPSSEASYHYLNLALNSQGYLPHGRYHKCTLFLRKVTLLICLNNKMLKSDWFLKALIYGLIWLLQHQNCPIWPVRLLAAYNRTVQQPIKVKHQIWLTNEILLPS